MSTVTATYAQAGAQARTNLGFTAVTGQVSPGCLSPSASAVLLLAKLPHGAQNIRIGVSALHTGATGAKIQAGIVRNGSATASAVLTLTDLAVTNRIAWTQSTSAYSPDWDNYTGGPAYVQVSNGSGTISAGFVLDYQITYDFEEV